MCVLPEIMGVIRSSDRSSLDSVPCEFSQGHEMFLDGWRWCVLFHRSLTLPCWCACLFLKFNYKFNFLIGINPCPLPTKQEKSSLWFMGNNVKKNMDTFIYHCMMSLLLHLNTWKSHHINWLLIGNSTLGCWGLLSSVSPVVPFSISWKSNSTWV